MLTAVVVWTLCDNSHSDSSVEPITDSDSGNTWTHCTDSHRGGVDRNRFYKLTVSYLLARKHFYSDRVDTLDT